MERMHAASKKDWRTPKWLRRYVIDRWRINFDAAASHENALVDDYYIVEDNALGREWPGDGFRIFCNPPYTRLNGGIGAWLEKGYDAFQRGAQVTFLLPANTASKWYEHYGPRGSTFLLMPRVAFEDNNGNLVKSPPYASMLLRFGERDRAEGPASDPMRVYKFIWRNH